MTYLARELTPRGRGGVAVLEVRGPGARDAVEALCAAKLRPGKGPALVRLTGEDHAFLDEAIALVDPSGERVELHVHGSPPLVARLLEALGPGEPGESEPRTLEARASARLAHAPCEAAARILLDQAEGATRRAFDGLEGGEGWAAALDAYASRWGRVRQALEPPTVVLAGPVNAGKSTLFNLLCGTERVVVSAEEGTTRDLLHERVLCGPYALELWDTAGARSLTEPDRFAEVEREGQARALEAAARADLVLWLAPGGCGAPPESLAGPRCLLVASRADEGAGAVASEVPALAAVERPLEARATFEALVTQALGLDPDPWIAGQAVPITAGEARRAAELARDDPGSVGARRSALRRLLDEPPVEVRRAVDRESPPD